LISIINYFPVAMSMDIGGEGEGEGDGGGANTGVQDSLLYRYLLLCLYLCIGILPI
jgi:hypothetical protein